LWVNKNRGAFRGGGDNSITGKYWGGGRGGGNREDPSIISLVSVQHPSASRLQKVKLKMKRPVSRRFKKDY